MKTYEGVRVKLHAFLNSATNGGESSSSCCGLFNPGTNFVGGRLAPGLCGPEVDCKHFCTSWESNPGLPAHGLVTILIDLPWLHNALKLNTTIFRQISFVNVAVFFSTSWYACVSFLLLPHSWGHKVTALVFVCLCVCAARSRRIIWSLEMQRLHILGQGTGESCGYFRQWILQS
jgi:hypothetical protein